MTHDPNPELVDDETPEADADWFAAAKPASQVLPALLGHATSTALLERKVGRPPLATPKEHLNLRLDADVVTAFRSTGRGWQTRLNDALREWLRTHPDLTAQDQRR